MKIKIHANAPSYAVSSIHRIKSALSESCFYKNLSYRWMYDRFGNIDFFIDEASKDDLKEVFKNAAEALETKDFDDESLAYDAARAELVV